MNVKKYCKQGQELAKPLIISTPPFPVLLDEYPRPYLQSFGLIKTGKCWMPAHQPSLNSIDQCDGATLCHL